MLPLSSFSSGVGREEEKEGYGGKDLQKKGRFSQLRLHFSFANVFLYVALRRSTTDMVSVTVQSLGCSESNKTELYFLW